MSRRLALVLVGDVMLGRIVDESLTALPRQLHDGVWGDVLPLLKVGMVAGVGEEQLVAGNLECAVTAEDQKVGGREGWLAAAVLHPCISREMITGPGVATYQERRMSHNTCIR